MAWGPADWAGFDAEGDEANGWQPWQSQPCSSLALETERERVRTGKRIHRTLKRGRTDPGRGSLPP
jgi:hypothetical protein